MDSSVDIVSIKQEIPDRSSSHLQSYIDSFNKELQGGAEAAVPEAESGFEELISHDENGTYFVDQDGHYYFQPASAADDGVTFPAADIITPDDTEDVNGDVPNQLILGGQDEFQTVTLVPSKAENGEVTYMLIVQENEDDGQPTDKPEDRDVDIAVYDFDDLVDDEANEQSADSDPEVKFKIPKARKQRVAGASYKCPYCEYQTHKKYLLNRHLKCHSDERPHKCKICERGFKTAASLHNHINTHTGAKPHVCKFCDKGFTTSGELVRHVRYRHTRERPHQCRECGYASVELSKLKRHVRCHTGERPYQCPHCTYASPDTFKLKRHLRTHTGERPYVCNQCGQRFTQSNSLKIHRLRHNPEDRPMFQCELCPTKCGRKTDLRIHVQKLHTTDKLFNCKRCGKTCPDRYTYKMHIKTHSGEKCYKCDLCPYSSISQRHLESHIFIHTNEKPFVCDQCDQSFRQAQLLKRHQNLYHNPNYVPPKPLAKNNQCQECKRMFRHKGNLLRHMALHDPDSKYQELSIALKLGRQKKIHVLGDSQVELPSSPQHINVTIDNEDYPDEIKVMMDEGRMVNVASEDGQEYVVFEVVQVPDDEQEGDSELDQVDYIMPDHYPTDQDEELPVEDEAESKPFRTANANMVKTMKTELDLETCFGFGDEDEEED